MSIAAVAVIVTPATALANNQLWTMAGTGTATFAGDGGIATAGSVSLPRGMLELADGTIVFADTSNNRVRAIAPDGTLSTVLGTGAATSTGDGGPATAATTYSPRDVVFAGDYATSGALYVSESGTHRVRRFVIGGNVTTIAGNGVQGSTGDGGAATSARLNGPFGLSVAPTSGDLYIADAGSAKIRKVAAAGDRSIGGAETISTVAGVGINSNTGDFGPATSAAIGLVQDVLVISETQFLITDVTYHRLRMVTNGTIAPFAGSPAGTGCTPTTALCGDGQDAAAALFSTPAQTIPDGAGGYLVADAGTRRVRRISSTGVVSTFMGSGVNCTATNTCGEGARAEIATLNGPAALLVRSGDAGFMAAGRGTEVIVADSSNKLRVRIPDAASTLVGPTGPAGTPGPVGATGTQGAQGAQGSTGTTGATGPQGPQGPAGRTGRDGDDGRQGVGGPYGTNGRSGQSGDAGADGAPGAKGQEGDPGKAGAQGNVFGSLSPLAVVLPSTRILARPSRHTYIRMFVTGPGTVRLRVLADGHLVTMAQRTFKRVGRKRFDVGRLATDRYRVVAEILGVGEGARDKATLVVR